MTKTLTYLAKMALAALLLAPAAANAVNTTFTGTGVSGTDPLGSNWTAGANFAGFATWTEPLAMNQFPAFNPTGVSNGAGNFATTFTFTYTGSDNSVLNTNFDEEFAHVQSPQGYQWTPEFLSSRSIRFTAPTGDQLNPNDTFDVYVGFQKAIDPSKFAFTATWGDTSVAAAVPDAPTWAMMLGGFGLMGVMMRRRPRTAASFG
ncbi:MAG: PEP-CTERM sorting domain-containing protein [Janthinobacterium lividum]